MVRLGVLASGTKSGGGSGFENLVLQQRAGQMPGVEIVAVGSNIYGGGVQKRANIFGIPFCCFERERPTADDYQNFVTSARLDFVALSGFLLSVKGLDPSRTINIHPGPLPDFGGEGMYSHHVHEAVIAVFKAGKIYESAVSMHFVTPEYDKGPIFFRLPVPIYPGDTAETLGTRVNQCEHIWQPWATFLVCSGWIRWDGRYPVKIGTPEWYHYLPIIRA